jgi:hypothetical protein
MGCFLGSGADYGEMAGARQEGAWFPGRDAVQRVRGTVCCVIHRLRERRDKTLASPAKRHGESMVNA